MFTEATNYLPATNTDTHALVAYGRFPQSPGCKARLYSFKSYELALAAYEAAVEYAVGNGMTEAAARMIFAVRSMDDPTIAATGVPTEQYVPYRVVAGAVAEALRNEERETVKWALGHATDGTGFENLVRMSLDSMKQRGWQTEAWRIRDTLKSMVTIGRCHSCPTQTGGRGRRAYFFKRSTKATLAHVRCPECGRHLSQTTLALIAPFHFIADPVSTYFAPGLDALPGENNDAIYRRLDRVHAAIDAERGLGAAMDAGGW